MTVRGIIASARYVTNNCSIGLRRAGIEMFTLSIRRQEYLMKVMFYGLRCSAVCHTLIRQDLCLRVSADRVWLVSRFYSFYIIFLHYYKAQAFSISTVQSDAFRCCPLQSNVRCSPMQLLVSPHWPAAPPV